MNNTLNKTLTAGNFDSIFTEVKHNESLNLKNQEALHLFHLDIKNNEFNFINLKSFIGKNIGQYVFSRAKINEYINNQDAFSVGMDAVNKLKNSINTFTGDELGEILIYIFLEEILKAPKILTKVEFKNQNSYSDSIHLLELSPIQGHDYYHMVFGTSNIIGDMKNAIDNAFDKIININNQSNDEYSIVESNLFSKNFDDKTTEYLKSILIPSENKNSYCDTAYGLFLGYDLGLNKNNYTTQNFREKVLEKMKIDIKNHSNYITKKINDNGLNNYSFYVYILPFNSADQDKCNIINDIICGR